MSHSTGKSQSRTGIWDSSPDLQLDLWIVKTGGFTISSLNFQKYLYAFGVI